MIKTLFQVVCKHFMNMQFYEYAMMHPNIKITGSGLTKAEKQNDAWDKFCTQYDPRFSLCSDSTVISQIQPAVDNGTMVPLTMTPKK